jgi:hypothetical protein
MLLEHFLQVSQGDDIREGIVVIVLRGAARIEMLEARCDDDRANV